MAAMLSVRPLLKSTSCSSHPARLAHIARCPSTPSSSFENRASVRYTTPDTALGPNEVPLCQALGKQAHAVAAESQRLDAIVLAAQKDKYLAIERFFGQACRAIDDQPSSPQHISATSATS